MDTLQTKLQKALKIIVVVVGGMVLFASLMALRLQLQNGSKAKKAGVNPFDSWFLGSTEFRHLLLPDGHLKIALKDSTLQKADRNRLEQVFPNPAERRAVLEWGRGLFLSAQSNYRAAQMRNRSKGRKAANERIRDICEAEVTDDLAAHAAWQRLIAAPGAHEGVIRNLKTEMQPLLDQHPQRKELIAWTKLRRQQLATTWTLPDDSTATHCPPPPDTPWFDLWLLYQDWCLSEEMLHPRRLFFDSIFGGDSWKDLINYGEKVLKERTENGHPLPGDSEQAKVIAAIDRLSGIEPDYSRQVQQVGQDVFNDWYWVGNEERIFDFAPNNSTYVAPETEYIAFGSVHFQYVDGPYLIADSIKDREFQVSMEEGGVGGGVDSLLAKTGLKRLFQILFLAITMWYPLIWTIRITTVDLLGRKLGMGDSPKYQEFQRAFHEYFWFQLAVLPFVIFLSWIFDLMTLNTVTSFWVDSSGSILLASAAGLFLGSAIFDVLRNLVTLAFLRANVDVLRKFVDDIVAFVLSSLLLKGMGASWVTIILGGLLGVLSPWGYARWVHMKKPQAK